MAKIVCNYQEGKVFYILQESGLSLESPCGEKDIVSGSRE